MAYEELASQGAFIVFAAFLLSFGLFPLVVAAQWEYRMLSKKFPKIPSLFWIWFCTLSSLLFASLLGLLYLRYLE